jgi:translation initiation factor IF-2
MATARVYILARELGVKSSAVVQKCQAEGLDVKNHMSVISAGLAATIREWFSEGENITTVETARKVDLKKARVRRKTRRKLAPKKQEGERPGPELQVAPAAEPEQPVLQERAPQELAGFPPAQEVVAAVEEPPKEPGPEPAPAPAAEAEPPQPPQPVVPAGPMLERPEPAKLSGPTVIRVEEPEPAAPPRPKTRYDVPITEPLMYSEEDSESGVAAPHREQEKPAKRHKERTHGRRRDGQDVEVAKKVKFTKWRQRDIEERQARLEAAGGEGLRLRPSRRIAPKQRAEAPTLVRPKQAVVTEPITVKNLSAALAVKSADILAKLIKQGVMATSNQVITNEAAELVALEFGTELVVGRKSRIEDEIKAEFEQRRRSSLKKRPVVATMLGHVDHGKTSLLDKIRSTHVTATEAGGITQHIGAYQVARDSSRVTFLDTPGHEAFTAMRARGANMTDVAVLVVAADDGVMPQTVEAIAHARAADVPVIVALNKIDLPGYDVNRIYAQLAEKGLAPAEWGGETEVVKTSAATGEGIDDLLEHLDYVAELLDLKADDTVPATGWVVEAKMSAQRGAVATLLVKEGRLIKGDAVLAGTSYGRVKTLKDSHGRNIKVATSSTPVEITGLSDVPLAGDRFYCLDDVNRAKAAADENRLRERESSLAKRTKVTLDNLFTQIEAGNVKELNLIIRADVQGSVDVLKKYLTELSTDEVKVKILHAAPGGITEGDVVLAEASNAIIIGFNVIADERVAKIAETKGVDIRLYSVIYRITEDLRKSMAGLLEPEEKVETLGRAVVRQTFKISRIGTVAGCYVSAGLATKNAMMRLIRDNIVIRDDLTVESLKHFKDDVREVKAGLECGVKLARFDDVKIDDVLEFYEVVKVEREL